MLTLRKTSQNKPINLFQKFPDHYSATLINSNPRKKPPTS